MADDIDALFQQAMTAARKGNAAPTPAVPSASVATPAPADDVDAQFEQHMAAARAAQSATMPAPAASVSSDPVLDMEGNVVGAPVDTPLAILKKDVAAVKGNPIVQAAAQGWTDSQNPLMSPLLRQKIEQSGPVGYWLTSPLLQAAGAVPAALSALGAGTTQAVNEATTAAGVPTLARDLNPLLMSAGVVMGGAPDVPLTRAGLVSREMNAPAAPQFIPGAGGLTPADTVAAPLPAQFRDNPLASTYSGQPNRLGSVTLPAGDGTIQIPARDAAPAPTSPNPNLPAQTAPPTEAPGIGAPGPQSVGAAASRDMSHPSVIEMTPAQVQAYRSTAEGQKLLEPQQPGIADTRTYVPGVSASTAEIEQTVNAAREAKAANVAYPEVSQEAKEQAAANNEARGQYYSNIAGSDVSLMNLKDARDAEAKAGYSAAFANKTDADVTPIVNHIQDLLDQPRNRQNTELQAYVQPLLDRLQNADGTPKIVDPEELYGFREAVNKMTSKASKRKDPGLDHVTTELNNIVKVTDPQIEAAAPGYRDYMDNYAARSRQIDEQQVLQDAEPKLYAGSQMTYNKVQNFMRNVVDARQSSGLNPYKSITDDTMQRLWNLRDDLRRSASAQELARTPGSDTTQTMLDLAKRGAAVTGKLAVHGAANHFFPILGSLGVNAVDAAIGNRLAARARQKGIAQGLSNLNPNRLQAPEP